MWAVGRGMAVSHAENVALLQGYDYVEVSALTGLHMGQLLDAIDRRLQLVRALRYLHGGVEEQGESAGGTRPLWIGRPCTDAQARLRQAVHRVHAAGCS